VKASGASDDIVRLGKLKRPCICVSNSKRRPRLVGVLNERQVDIAPARGNVRAEFGKPLEKHPGGAHIVRDDSARRGLSRNDLNRAPDEISPRPILIFSLVGLRRRHLRQRYKIRCVPKQRRAFRQTRTSC
jgi:hypothetical protein